MRQTGYTVLLALVALGVGCSNPGLGHGDSGVGDGDVAGDGDADNDGESDGDTDDQDSDIPDDQPFAVTGVIPNHGIFSGFTAVVVRAPVPSVWWIVWCPTYPSRRWIKMAKPIR